MAGLERLLPFYPNPGKPGFVNVFGSALWSALLNGAVLFILASAVCLAVKVVF